MVCEECLPSPLHGNGHACGLEVCLTDAASRSKEEKERTAAARRERDARAAAERRSRERQLALSDCRARIGHAARRASDLVAQSELSARSDRARLAQAPLADAVVAAQAILDVIIEMACRISISHLTHSGRHCRRAGEHADARRGAHRRARRVL